MKRLILLVLFFTQTALSIKAQADKDSLKYFAIINTGDCINCQISLRALMSSEFKEKIILVFRNKDKNYAPNYVSELEESITHKVNYTVSDSLILKLIETTNFSISKFVAKKSNRIIHKSDLQKTSVEDLKLITQTHSLNSEQHQNNSHKIEVIANFDSIRRLSNLLVLNNYQDNFSFKDYAHGKIYVYNHQQKSVINYGPQRVSLKQATTWYYGDSSNYHRYIRPIIPQLKKLNKYNVRAENLTQRADTTFVLYSFTQPAYITRDSKKEIELSSKYILITYLNNKVINYNQIPEEISSNYYIIPGVILHKINNSFLISIGKDDLTKPNYLIAVMNPGKKHKLSFSKFNNIQLPDFFIKDSITYEYISNKTKNNSILLNYDNKIYSLINNSKTQLNIEQHRSKSDNEYEVDNLLLDFYTKDNILYFIINKAKNMYQLTKTNIKSNVTQNTNLPIKEDQAYSNPIFGPKERIYYINNQHQLVMISTD